MSASSCCGPSVTSIQHADQKGIIHRDLKPSNVLIVEADGRRAPKVIDFGIAKAVDEGLFAGGVHTRAGVVMGTLDYMSPEQWALRFGSCSVLPAAASRRMCRAARARRSS